MLKAVVLCALLATALARPQPPVVTGQQEPIPADHPVEEPLENPPQVGNPVGQVPPKEQLPHETRFRREEDKPVVQEHKPEDKPEVKPDEKPEEKPVQKPVNLPASAQHSRFRRADEEKPVEPPKEEVPAPGTKPNPVKPTPEHPIAVEPVEPVAKPPTHFRFTREEERPVVSGEKPVDVEKPHPIPPVEETPEHKPEQPVKPAPHSRFSRQSEEEEEPKPVPKPDESRQNEDEEEPKPVPQPDGQRGSRQDLPKPEDEEEPVPVPKPQDQRQARQEPVHPAAGQVPQGQEPENLPAHGEDKEPEQRPPVVPPANERPEN